MLARQFRLCLLFFSSGLFGAGTGLPLLPVESRDLLLPGFLLLLQFGNVFAQTLALGHYDVFRSFSGRSCDNRLRANAGSM